MTKASAALAEALSPELKPYLSYSLGLHVALVLVAWRLVAWRAGAPKADVYSIDFVGGPAVVATSAAPAAEPTPTPPPAAQPPATRPPPQAQFDEFGRRRKKFALPRPSLLRGWKEPKEQEEAKPSPQPSAAPAEAGAGGGAGAEASADMPNFPYPWYIARVRQLLWERWQANMPRQAGESVVVFSLLPDGRVVDLRTESSSGDSAFDIAALSAVQDAAPYPPLPPGFSEPFLKIHVTLRSQ